MMDTYTLNPFMRRNDHDFLQLNRKLDLGACLSNKTRREREHLLLDVG
jgi:hypothetical protein